MSKTRLDITIDPDHYALLKDAAAEVGATLTGWARAILIREAKKQFGVTNLRQRDKWLALKAIQKATLAQQGPLELTLVKGCPGKPVQAPNSPEPDAPIERIGPDDPRFAAIRAQKTEEKLAHRFGLGS